MKAGLLLIAWLIPAMFAQENAPTFRSDVILVRVEVQVVDSRGAPVPGLKQDDFRVFEDGKPQPIAHFASDSDPLDLLLLLDKSGSMHYTVAAIASSAMKVLSNLRPGDRVGAALFDSKCWPVAALTPDVQRVASALENQLREEYIIGDTNIHGAIFDAARYLRQQQRNGSRRSILILTDDRAPHLNDRAVLDELWEADAVLDALIFQQEIGLFVSGWRNHPRGFCEYFAERTGGEIMKATAPIEDLCKMLERIRKRYSLFYRPPAGPALKPRSIRVVLNADAKKAHPKATLRARRGYSPGQAAP